MVAYFVAIMSPNMDVANAALPTYVVRFMLKRPSTLHDLFVSVHAAMYNKGGLVATFDMGVLSVWLHMPHVPALQTATVASYECWGGWWVLFRIVL